MRRALLLAVSLLTGTAALANPPEKVEAAFAARFAALRDGMIGVVSVRMKATDDPASIPDASTGSGPTLVSGTRLGIYTPDLITPKDMLLVVNQNMAAVRACYKQQLAADPNWSENVILDLAVKKTGRVSEVAIAPTRAERSIMGQCLLRAISRWKFPEFTGEAEDGVTHEVVNASFPFSFATKD